MTVQELTQKLNEFPGEFKVGVKIPYYGHEDEVYDMESNGIESVTKDEIEAEAKKRQTKN